jgi:hypothetical protein
MMPQLDRITSVPILTARAMLQLLWCYATKSVILTFSVTLFITILFHVGDIQMALSSEKGTDVPLSVTDNEDGTFTVDYCAPTPGNYTLNVLYGGITVPRCPLRVPVQPHVDVSKIKVDGLEPSKLLVNYCSTHVCAVLWPIQNI